MNDDLVKAARVFLAELQRQREAFASTKRGKLLAEILDGVCETLLDYFETTIEDGDEIDRLIDNLEV